MTLTLKINGADRTANVLWDQCVFEEVASAGNIGSGTLVIRDPTGTLDPHFGHPVELLDGGNTTANRGWFGIIGGRYRGRDGDVDHYGVRRIHRLVILDRNQQLDKLRVEGWARPSETDYVRVRALMSDFRPTVERTTYVPNSGNVTMDKRTYTDSMIRDVVADCAAATGKDYWIDKQDFLHYAVEGSLGSNQVVWTLTDTVGTYITDVRHGTAGSAYNVGEIERFDDPNAIPFQNDVMLKYGTNKHVTVVDSASAAIYSHIQGLPIYDDRATSEANATARANVILERAKVPEISYTTTIALPRLDFISAGKYVLTTSHHEELTSSPLRIVRWRAVRHGNAWDGYWVIDLDLATPRRTRAVSLGFKSTNPQTEFPDTTPVAADCETPTGWSDHTGVVAGSLCPPVSFSPSGAPTGVFATLIGAMVNQDGTSVGWEATMSPYTTLGDDGSIPGDYTHTLSVVGYMGGSAPALNFGWTTNGWACAEQAAAAAAFIPTAATAPLQFGSTLGSGSVVTLTNPPTEGNLLVAVKVGQMTGFLPEAGWDLVVSRTYPTALGTNEIRIISRCVGAGESSSIGVGDSSFAHWLYLTEWEITQPPEPVPGQWYQETLGIPADGTTRLFTTSFPYQPGSLQVFANGVQETLFVETDPTTGQFTFNTAPFVGENIHVIYVVTA